MEGKIPEKGEIKSMRKKILTLVAVAVMTMAMSVTAFADGAWQHDDTGRWWLRFPNMYYIDQWKWIDSDADGILSILPFFLIY